MSVNYIHLAIPVFFLLIGIEVLAARLLEREVYRLNDSINDLSCGILDQVVEVFLKTVLFAGYLFIFERGRLFSIPTPSGRWGDRFRLFWKPPAWHPDDLGGSVGTTEVDRATLVKYDPPAPRGLRLYVLSQFVLVNAATTAFLFGSVRMSGPGRAAAAIAVALSLASLGGLLDRRPWAFRLEVVRVVGLAGMTPWLAAPGVAVPVAAAGLGSLGWLLHYRRDCDPAPGLPRAA